MSFTAYRFYFTSTFTSPLYFPVTPESLSVAIKNQNETVTLINDGEVSVLKQAGLTEVSFTARFPRRSQPYVIGTLYTVQHYLSVLEKLKTSKLAFEFHVTRNKRDSNGYGGTFEATSMTVSLEDYTIKEDAEYGDDVMVEISLKQYRPYKTTRTKVNSNGTATSTASKEKPTTSTSSGSSSSSSGSTTLPTKHTVKRGDCLTSISKKYYGVASKWTKIYNENKELIESDAKKHGRSSSSNGHWIYDGTVLTIPK